MSISVNVRSWFVCKLCAAALFPTAVDFVEHKMTSHFNEFEAQNVSEECFLFEERTTPFETADNCGVQNFSEDSSLVEDKDPLNTEGNSDPEIAAYTAIKTEGDTDPLNLNDFTESSPLIPAQDPEPEPLTQESPSTSTDSVRFSFQCQLCAMEFNSEPELTTHNGTCSLYSQHQNPFSIPFNKLFPPRAYYDGHNVKFRAAKEKKTKFGICQNNFGTASVSKIHTKLDKKKEKQDGSGSFTCEEGGSSSSTKHIETHHSKVHSDVRPFLNCSTCSASFKKRCALAVHEVTHSDERPFSCPQPNCGKTYKRKSSLAVHIGVHLPERRFHCPVLNCGEKFRIKTQLTRHLAVRARDPLH